MPINKIVVVGDGLAAWLCASALARSVGKAVGGISVVGTSNDNHAGIDNSLGMPLIACSSGPVAAKFNRHVGYEESSLIATTRGGYTLGTAISGWSPSGTFFNPFGEIGAPLGPVSFQQLSMKLRATEQPMRLANYSLAALCAQAGRFAKPADNDNTVLSELNYGLQIDIPAYAAALKADALSHGVTEIQSAYERITIDEQGLIEAIITSDGAVMGDLFVDCTGAARSIINSMPVKHHFIDWGPWLPCSHVNNVANSTTEAPLPFTHLQAEPSGWRYIISLQGKRCEIQCSAMPDGDSIFHAGFLENPWKGNCVAIGGAAVAIDPVTSLAFDLLCSGVDRLVGLIPNDRRCEQEMIEFNRQSHAEADCARDYAIAHYKLNSATGKSFWDECKRMPIPDTLSHRIEIYKNCGRVVMRDGEMVDRMNWVSLFDAGGIPPEQYDVVARSLPMSLINEHMASIRQTLLSAVSALPSYQSYLSQLR